MRGDDILNRLRRAGTTMRNYADDMVAEWVPLGIESEAPKPDVNPRQDAMLREHLDERKDLHEAIRELGPMTNEQVLDVAYALCRSPDDQCARHLAAALRKVRYIEPGFIDNQYVLPSDPVHTCDPYVVHVRSPKMGFGFEYGEGWQASRNPVDGRAWSLGLEARARLRDKLGMVARIDRSTGRDDAIDSDGDGHDDTQTGAVVRWTAMVGPSLRLSQIRHEDMSRYWQVDSLVGLSRDASRSGPIVGMDFSYQFLVMRVGVRMVQGFGDANDEKSLLVHSGLMFGAGPQFDYGAGCGNSEQPRGSAWAIALDLPLVGYAQEDGWITPGFGLEGALHLHEMFDFLVHGDVLVMPRGDDERALHQTVLAGGRIDFSNQRASDVKGVFATLSAGYDFVAAPSSAAVQSGPVVEGSVAWGAQASDGAAWLRLHGRFGVGPANSDLRAVFLSFGMEFRLDRTRWRDRN